MRVATLLAAMAALLLASGCNSSRDGLGEVGSNFSASNDANGTQRRPDVNYRYTRPTLPTFGQR